MLKDAGGNDCLAVTETILSADDKQENRSEMAGFLRVGGIIGEKRKPSKRKKTFERDFFTEIKKNS